MKIRLQVLKKLRKNIVLLFAVFISGSYANAQCDSTFTSSGDSTIISFSPTDIYASSYFWNFGDGSTSADVTPIHTYADTGSYTVCVDVITFVQGQQETCSSCEDIIVGLPDVSTANMIKNNDFKFNSYPNPFANEIVITHKNSDNENLFFQIFDLSGKVINTYETKSSTIKINTFDLENGIYFIKLTTSNGYEISKKVIKH